MNKLERNKLKMRTQKLYQPGPCSVYWTPEDWEASAVYRSEPRRMRALGYVWRAIERGADGVLRYIRAEKIEGGEA